MNTDIESKEIDNISKFIDEIKVIGTDKKLWFRGLNSIDFKLEPSIYRDPFKSKFEDHFQTKFISRSMPYIPRSPNIDSYWEWLFLMQHHGVPTRLLDWTTNAFTSFAFALLFRDEKYKDDDAAIWCLDPVKLNENVRISLDEKDKIPDISNTKVQGLFKLEITPQQHYPIAISGPLNSDRIVAQKGVFTLFPNKDEYFLEDTDRSHEFLWRMVIKKDKVNDIKNELISLGITETTVYPDLNSLALEIRREFKDHPLI